VLPFEYLALNGEIKKFGVLEISNGSTLISTAANAIASSPNGYSITFANPAYRSPGEPQFKTDTFYGKFIAHKIYNAVWNDIAEFMPSDGTTEAGDLVVVDVEYSDYGFRITKYNALKHSIGNVIGIHSQNPGMVLGWNANYQHPVEVALKGMVPLKLSYFVDIPKVGERIFLFKDGNVTLADRQYICQCGYSQDRDIHAAMNILLASVPMGRGEFKPVEFNTSTLDYLKSFASVNYEAGRHNSLELC